MMNHNPKDYTLEEWVKLWQQHHDKAKGTVTYWMPAYTTHSELYRLIDAITSQTEIVTDTTTTRDWNIGDEQWKK